MKIGDLEKAVRISWIKETCYPPMASQWSSETPELGQCAVTSFVVQDYFGGEILFCRHNNHYWNRLPNGEEVDITRNQFKAGTVVCVDEIRSRQNVIEEDRKCNARTEERYLILKSRVEEKLGF